MDYIVLDLEWNQSPRGKEGRKPGIPFEIIEIGAVKMDKDRNIVDQFHEMICPKVYHQLHFKTKEIIKISMKDLKKCRTFPEVIEDFFKWCGNDFRMCTWGSMDLTELQRNIAYFHKDNLLGNPLLYLDIQKLYSIRYDDGKSRMALKDAVEEMGIEQDIPFHRALDDTIYTARVIQKMDLAPVVQYVSVDYFNLPEKKEDELYFAFESYTKYVSRIFQSKDVMLADKNVSQTRCCSCKRALRKKVRWFPVNGKTYVCVSECPEHGLMKSKLRIKKAEHGGIFAVKTSKMIDAAAADEIKQKKTEINRRKKLKVLSASTEHSEV